MHRVETNRLRSKGLEKSRAAQRGLIARQDQRIGDLHASTSGLFSLLAVIGIVLGAIGLIIGLLAASSYIFTHKKAMAAVKDWISENETSLQKNMEEQVLQRLQPNVDRMEQRAQRRIFDNVTQKAREIDLMHDTATARCGEIHRMYDGTRTSYDRMDQVSIPEAEKAQIDKASTRAGKVPEADRLFDDWAAQAYGALGRNENVEASEAFGKAAHSRDATDEQAAQALYNMSYTLEAADELAGAMNGYNETVQLFGDSNAPEVRYWVAASILNKGVLLGATGDYEEAIEAFGNTMLAISEFDDPRLQTQAGRALLNTGISLGQIGKHGEALTACGEVIRRFGDSDDPDQLQLAASAAVNQGVALERMGRHAESNTVFKEIVRRFEKSDDSEILKHVASAKNSIAFSLLLMAKHLMELSSDENTPMRMLKESLEIIESAIATAPDDPLLLGNSAYVLFFLGRIPKAESQMRRALELGGKKQKLLELEDATRYPLPQDEDFKDLINRIWDEVARETDGEK